MDGELAPAILEATAQRRYIARGRALVALSNDALAKRWTAAYRAWAPTGDPERGRIEEDARCELQLRGLPVPIETVKAEMAVVMERHQRWLAEGTFGRAGLADDLSEEMEAELGKKH